MNLSLCVDETWHIDEAIRALREEEFDVMKVSDMELLTIRGYKRRADGALRHGSLGLHPAEHAVDGPHRAETRLSTSTRK